MNSPESLVVLDLASEEAGPKPTRSISLRS